MITPQTIDEQVAILRRQVLAGSKHVEYLQNHPFPTLNQKEILAEYLRKYCS